jgi:transcription elongation factor Elf1
MIFKALTRQAQDYLRELFTEYKNDFYCLRCNDTKLALPKARTNFQKNVFRIERQSRVERIIE